MTEEGERALLRDYLATCARLAGGFEETVALVARLLPLNPSKRAVQLNTAWDARGTLSVTWAAIGRFVEEEGLLK